MAKMGYRASKKRGLAAQALGKLGQTRQGIRRVSETTPDNRKVKVGGSGLLKKTTTYPKGSEAGTGISHNTMSGPNQASIPNAGPSIGTYSPAANTQQYDGTGSTLSAMAAPAVDKSVRTTQPIAGSGLVSSNMGGSPSFSGGKSARSSGLSDVLRRTNRRRKTSTY